MPLPPRSFTHFSAALRENSAVDRLTQLLFLSATVFAITRTWGTEGYTDFDLYFRQASRFLSQLRGESPSFLLVFGETASFRYAPVWGWVFAPFALLPIELARLLWVTLQWGALAATLIKLRRSLGLSSSATLIVLVGMLRFAIDNSQVGQISTLLACLFVFSALNRARTSAVTFAAGALLKFQAVLLLGVELARKDSRRFALGLAALAAGGLLSLTFGAEPFQIWFELLLRPDALFLPNTLNNQSLFGAFIRIAPSRSAQLFLSILIVSVTIAGYQWRRRGLARESGLALGLALIPIFGVVSQKNLYLLWILPLAYLARARPKAAALCATLFTTPSQFIIGSAANEWALRYGLLPLTALLFALFVLPSALPEGECPVPPVTPETTSSRSPA